MKNARIELLVVVSLAFGACWAGLAHAGSDPETEKYAPLVRLVRQTESCGHGEPYDPASVDVVLGKSEVALRGPWSGSSLVNGALIGLGALVLLLLWLALQFRPSRSAFS